MSSNQTISTPSVLVVYRQSPCLEHPELHEYRYDPASQQPVCIHCHEPEPHWQNDIDDEQ